jgi:hypothetical protein
MQCTVHPSVQAADRCAGCAEPFCENCLVDVQGKRYCSQCKVLAIQGKAPALTTTRNSKEAGEALKYGVVSLLCFGFILGPIAISKALKAKKEIAADPTLGGSGMATAGMILGALGFIFWVMAMFVRFSQMR